MVSKLKRLPKEWKKIFVIFASDKASITRIYKDLKKKLNSPEINDPMKKWTNEFRELLQKKNSKWLKNT
jgi:hypothetical protein